MSILTRFCLLLDIEESVVEEESADTNNNGNTILAPNLYDCVTECENMPRWLTRDPFSGKYTLSLHRFDWDNIPKSLQLNEKSLVTKMKWPQFNKLCGKLISSFYDVLAVYYKHGLSPIFRHKFVSALASRLNYMAKRYEKIRKSSSEGRLLPDLSKTVKKLINFEVRTCFFGIFS